MKFEYPLQWLPQQPRTKRPERARFGNHSTSKAGNYLADELVRLGAKNFILSQTSFSSRIVLTMFTIKHLYSLVVFVRP